MRIDTAEQGAPGRPTEDRIVVLPNAVVVLDGVTSRNRPPGQYVDQLAAELTRLIDDHTPLRDLLAEAIGSTTAPGASTVAITRWTADTIDALVLADSPVVAFGAHTHVLQDTRLADLRPKVDYVPGWKNRPGGYWVAEADPEAAHQALTATWPRAEIRSVIMATDGVSTGIDDYDLFTWEDLLHKSPQSVLDEIREAERSDPKHIKWPRYKTHDDQTLAIIHNT